MGLVKGVLFMSSANLEKVLDEVKELTPEEQRQHAHP